MKCNGLLEKEKKRQQLDFKLVMCCSCEEEEEKRLMHSFTFTDVKNIRVAGQLPL